ncbi:MAG: holo-ACP synthase [Candidatus Kariarchaeaceae archaeon]|jgi:phosphopantetheine--protein transferase-like protein
MIDLNIGVDICEVQRFNNLPISEYPHFYKRVFTEQERLYCMMYDYPERYFAGIFAAKEAIYKAVNHFCTISLLDIEILHEKNGVQRVKFNSVSATPLLETSINSKPLTVQISICQSESHCIAFALAGSNLSENIGKEIFQEIGKLKDTNDI